jgi:quercetin dioxygenase-like cupin family protein
MKIHDPRAAAHEAVATRSDRPAMALIHDTADARLIVFRIAPGQAVPAHTSSSTVVLYVLEGWGIVAGADAERAVGPGTVVTYEPRETHSMRADREQLTLLAVIAPRPASR